MSTGGEKITYVISIKSDSVDSGGKGVASDKNGNELSPKKPETKEGKYISKTFRKVASVGFAMQAIDMAISTQINTVEARTGNARLQELQSYAYSTAKSLLVATAAGAAAGGPVGAAIGAASAIVKRAVDIAIAQQQLDIAKSVEDVGLKMAHIRAGTGGSRNG